MSSRAERDYMANASPVDGNNKCDGRTIPLKVICPGLSRSGTGTMRQALEMLGIGRTFHGLRLNERLDDMRIWMEMVERKFPRTGTSENVTSITAKDFDKVIGDCGGVTDMPCAAFWRELMAAYPDAKVVLVERDLDAWNRSFNEIVIHGMLSVKGQILSNPWVGNYIAYKNPEMLRRVFLGYFQAHNKYEMAANAKRIYREHNEAIRTACRQEGRPLLDFQLRDGWEPLCRFLEVDAPKDVDFPRSNEADVLAPFIHKAQRQLLLGGVKKFLKQSAIAAVLLGVTWTIWRKPQAFWLWLDRLRLR